MRKPTRDERFDLKYVVDDATGCWIWQRANMKPNEYGKFYVGAGKQIGAHVYAYQRKYGPVPEGLVLDHYVCETRRCVNPDHVRPEGRRENIVRSAKWAGNRTHCPHGHEYTPENTFLNSNGARCCRVCSRMRNRAWYAANRKK